MLPNKEIMSVVADKLRQYNARNVVVDPVMVATSGAILMESDATDEEQYDKQDGGIQ